MNKKMLIGLVLVSALLIGANVVAAQSNGNGNGNGGANPGNCAMHPNCNAYSGNAQNGAMGNGQQRGNRGRGAGQFGAGFYGLLPPASVGELPQTVIDLMIDGWLDEQNAYAAYSVMIDQFGAMAPFVNLQRAEAQHIAAWEFLFDRYGLTAPELPEVTVPEFATVTEACQLGVDAEIGNFGLYDTMLAIFADYPDIYQVTQNLRDASEFNHLPALERCAQ